MELPLVRKIIRPQTENESSAGSGGLRVRLRSIMHSGVNLGRFSKTKCDRHLVHQGYVLSVGKYWQILVVRGNYAC